MHTLMEWFKTLYNVEYVVQSVGYAGLAAIIFTETGLLVGFFLPGDSLLFAAGMACVPNNAMKVDLNLLTLNLVLIPAAVIGDTVGYWIGYRAGKALYEREKTLFFRKDHLLATKAFYEEHGGITIVMARFVPLIRTFAPVVAGIAQMPYRTFLSYNVFGGIGWIISITVAGYFLGSFEFVKKHLDATLILIIFISLVPAAITFLKARSNSAKAQNGV